MTNVKEDKAYYTLITDETVYRNCSWKFADDNAVLGDKLITIKNGLLHHVRELVPGTQGKYGPSFEWEHIYEDGKREWVDMQTFRHKHD